MSPDLKKAPVGISALAVHFPEHVRTNDYWRKDHPDLVARAEGKTLSRVFGPGAVRTDWDLAMEPYLADPFRGTQERRTLLEGEGSRTMLATVARGALQARGIGPEGVDACMVAALRAQDVGPGDAAWLVGELGLECPAWNVESTCSSSLVALQSATALVRAGEYERILVLIACTYTKDCDEADTLSWFFGDGAGAFIVERLQDGQGVLSVKSVHTAATCGAFSYNLEGAYADGTPRWRIRTGKNTNQQLREDGERALRASSKAALDAAGLTIKDVDFFVCNTPTAWYSQFGARVLGIDPERTVSTYHKYANVGPALLTANLFEAASTGRIKEGDVVLVFTVATVGTAGCAVMRWGDVKLGTPPKPSALLPRD